MKSLYSEHHFTKKLSTFEDFFVTESQGDIDYTSPKIFYNADSSIQYGYRSWIIVALCKQRQRSMSSSFCCVSMATGYENFICRITDSSVNNKSNFIIVVT